MAEWLRGLRDKLHLGLSDAEIPLSQQTKQLLDDALLGSQIALARLNPELFVAESQFTQEAELVRVWMDSIDIGSTGMNMLERHVVMNSVGKGLTVSMAMLSLFDAYANNEKLMTEIYGVHTNLMLGNDSVHGFVEADIAFTPVLNDLQEKALEPWMDYIGAGKIRHTESEIFDHHLTAGIDNHSDVRMGYYFAQSVAGKGMIEGIYPEEAIRYIGLHPPSTLSELASPKAYSSEMIIQLDGSFTK